MLVRMSFPAAMILFAFLVCFGRKNMSSGKKNPGDGIRHCWSKQVCFHVLEIFWGGKKKSVRKPEKRLVKKATVEGKKCHDLSHVFLLLNQKE